MYHKNCAVPCVMCIPLITDQRRVHKYSDQTIPRINSLSHPLFHMIGFCNHKMKGISWYPSPPNQKNPQKTNWVEFRNHSFSTQHSPKLHPIIKLDTTQVIISFFLFICTIPLSVVALLLCSMGGSIDYHIHFHEVCSTRFLPMVIFQSHIKM